MSITIIYTVITVSSIGSLAAIILYFIAQKFKVYEDPRIDEVDAALPGANCGGCGYAGCRNFAEACVKADTMGDLFCPVGGNECMANVAEILGRVVVEKEPMVAVVRCNGCTENRPQTNQYDGALNCTLVSNFYSGNTDCEYGCLGLGECVDACKFGAMHMDEKTGLPVIDEDKCTSCGDCVTACPRNIIELRKKGKKGRRVFVSCVNKDKPAPAKKSCSVACIGCKKCVEVCPKDAITVENFLAYIDIKACIACRKCVAVCPTNAIHEINFPPRKPKIKKEEPSKDKSNTENKSIEKDTIPKIKSEETTDKTDVIKY